MTDDLTARVHAAVDAVEAAALAATRPGSGEHGDWSRGPRTPHAGTDVWDLISASTIPDRGFYRLADRLDPDVVDHIALHDPRTVLRRVAADRALLRVFDKSPVEYAEVFEDEVLTALAEGYGVTREDGDTA